MRRNQSANKMKTFGLIGNPLTHSFSKSYFEQKFKSEGLNHKYLNFELQDIDEFPKLIKEHPELCGLNVTIPYKQQVIRFLDEIEKEAHFIGAVNTIKFQDTGGKTKLIGYNTDAKGFEMALKPYLKNYHKKALILGTGGASKAIEFVLKKLGKSCTEVTRRPLKANQISYGLITKQLMEEHLIIINTTPLGMHPNNEEAPELPYKFIADSHLAFDLIYNPSETAFLKKARNNGAQTINGLKMLHYQADLAWKIWNT